MKKYYKTIIFSNSRLKTHFRYKNKFQILPIDLRGKPSNACARHFPLFLEYTIDYPNEKTDGFISIQAERINTENEIINLLSCLTNYHFFRYDLSMMGWGVIVPNKTENLTEEEEKVMNCQESQFFIGNYQYSGLNKDLQISQFTQFEYKTPLLNCSTYKYYTDNPIDDHFHDVLFHDTLIMAIDSYYNLPAEKRKKVRSSMCLACGGMDISTQKRTLSFLSYISAIEGLIGLEVGEKEIQFKCKSCQSILSSPYKCPECGGPIWGIKQKFVQFLSKYVLDNEKSRKKYKDIYNVRSKITHSGKLFMSDYELSFSEDSIKLNHDNWLMELETLQLFRISLNRWLRNSPISNIVQSNRKSHKTTQL